MQYHIRKKRREKSLLLYIYAFLSVHYDSSSNTKKLNTKIHSTYSNIVDDTTLLALHRIDMNQETNPYFLLLHIVPLLYILHRNVFVVMSGFLCVCALKAFLNQRKKSMMMTEKNAHDCSTFDSCNICTRNTLVPIAHLHKIIIHPFIQLIT